MSSDVVGLGIAASAHRDVSQHMSDADVPEAGVVRYKARADSIDAELRRDIGKCCAVIRDAARTLRKALDSWRDLIDAVVAEKETEVLNAERGAATQRAAEAGRQL